MVAQVLQTDLEASVWDIREPGQPGAPRTLGQKLDHIASAAADDLRLWYINARFFTDHGEPHVRGVIDALNRLLPQNMHPGGMSGTALHPYEAFLLLAAAWLHDTGMVEGSNWLKQAKEGGDKSPPAGCEDAHCPLLCGLPRKQKDDESRVIRRCHHCFSMWAINRLLGQVAGLTNVEAGWVGELARAHNRYADINQVEAQVGVLGVRVRPRFLASLLRLADAMDLAHPRVPDRHPDMFEKDREARFHWDLHHLVADVVPDLENGNIRVEIMAASEEDAAIVKRYRVGELQEELNSVMPVLAEHGIVFWGGVTEHTSLVRGLRHRVRLETPPARSEPSPAGGSRILVVDDDASPCKALADAIGRGLGNVVVDTAGSRAEAEEYLASRFYHAAVIDVGLEPRDYDRQRSLEDATGLFLLEDAPHPNRVVPAVLVSGHNDWPSGVQERLVALAREVDAVFLEKDLAHKKNFKRSLLDEVRQALARNM